MKNLHNRLSELAPVLTELLQFKEDKFKFIINLVACQMKEVLLNKIQNPPLKMLVIKPQLKRGGKFLGLGQKVRVSTNYKN